MRDLEQVVQTAFACLTLYRPRHWAYLFQFDYDLVHSSLLKPVNSDHHLCFPELEEKHRGLGYLAASVGEKNLPSFLPSFHFSRQGFSV